jgi:hypothetical protein
MRKLISIAKTVITNVNGVIGFSIFIESFFIFLSIKECNWMWFARSGAVLTLCGGVLASRRLIRKGVAGLIYDEYHIDYGGIEPTEEQLITAKQTEMDIKAARCAFCFISIGTLIWAFGDLL